MPCGILGRILPGTSLLGKLVTTIEDEDRTEGKGRRCFWGTYLNTSKEDLKKKIWKNIHFGTVVSWRNKLNGAAQGAEYDLLLWWGSVVYITSKKRTVRLGSLLGLYESFPIKK